MRRDRERGMEKKRSRLTGSLRFPSFFLDAVVWRPLFLSFRLLMSRDHPLFPSSSPFHEETDSAIGVFLLFLSLSLSFHVSLFTTTMTYSPYLLFRENLRIIFTGSRCLGIWYNAWTEIEDFLMIVRLSLFSFFFLFYFLSLQYRNRLILFFRKKKNYHRFITTRHNISMHGMMRQE